MKYIVEIEIEIPDISGISNEVEDANIWAASLLDCAFTKPNPMPCPQDFRLRRDWTPRVRVPPSEHIYQPKLIGSRKAS